MIAGIGGVTGGQRYSPAVALKGGWGIRLGDTLRIVRDKDRHFGGFLKIYTCKIQHKSPV